MKTLKTIVVSLILSISTGCIYSNVRMPLDKDFDKTTLGNKVGKSEAQSILWLVAWGDAGTQTAAEDGGLKIINHADAEFLSILFGLYSKETTILYGE